MRKPLVSVIIPTRDRHQDLRRCLESLVNQEFTDFETVVVNNGSHDATSDVLESFSTRVVSDPTPNLPHLFNHGCDEARGGIFAFINDDAEATATWLSSIVETLSKSEKIGAVGGPTIAIRQQEISGMAKLGNSSRLMGFAVSIYDKVICGGQLLNIGSYSGYGGFGIGGSEAKSAMLSKPIAVQLLSITNMAITKELFAKVGPFDERFRFSSYDTDFLLRVSKLGYTLIFDPRAAVYHHVSPLGRTRSPKVLSRDTALGWTKSFPRDLSGLLRLSTNVLFYNGFWIYKSISTGERRYLEGLVGFAEGMRDAIKFREIS